MPRRTVTLIATVYNEAENIAAFVQSLVDQSRQPDEIVIVDAGSTDGTIGVLREYIEEGFPARLIVEKGANRSRGRNRAIEEATGEVIAGIDAGCIAPRQWLSKLVAPFESEDPPDVVAGYYQPDTATALEDAIAAATVPDASEVDPTSFLPSGRSVAFTREVWERVGGYPEHVEYAEDTDFDLRLKAAGARFRFEPEAFVRWHMQTTLWGVFTQFLRYARSDGELNHWFGHYAKAYLGGLVTLLLLSMALAGSSIAPFLFLATIVAYWARYALRARRRGADWHSALLAPGISAIVDFAHVIGYLAGRARSRPRPARLPADRPLSIAQVTYTYRPVSGGADVYVAQLAEVIKSAGHRHRVYQRRAETDDPEVRWVPNPLHGRPFEFWTQAVALLRLWREVVSHDVVICHYPHYLLAVDLMSLFRRRPVRVAISHGVFWDDDPGSPRGAIKAWLTRLAFRRAHLYVANDTHFLRAMGIDIAPRQQMGRQIRPGVWFIPNGVDVDKFAPSDSVPAVRALHSILVPRNLFRSRGIHLAVDAFALFRQEHPETTLLIVGGGGQPSYAADLRREVMRRGLGARVLFHGPVPHDQLPAIYSSALMTLIPSLWGEGTSLSALESMACGTPTICTWVAGLRDLPGPHARPTATALAKVMHQVYAQRERIGEEQRRLVQAEHSLERWQAAWRESLATLGISAGDRDPGSG